MNASQHSALSSATQVDSSAAHLARAAAHDGERDHSHLLDLMGGDADDIDAFFERMFAD